jgi:hypothetical protein
MGTAFCLQTFLQLTPVVQVVSRYSRDETGAAAGQSGRRAGGETGGVATAGSDGEMAGRPQRRAT